MAQPAGIAEAMIEATADVFFASFLDGWITNQAAIPVVPRGVLRASCEAVPSIEADYRASAGNDVVHDRADLAAGRTPTMPVTAIQQDWGQMLGL